jgi:hypothetical protein
MGRWTPLILMAGGVAILLGTLIGINFPIGGQQTANVPSGRRESSVLPANINVNSTASRDDSAAVNRNNSQTTNTNRDDVADDTPSTSIAQSNANTGATGSADSTQGSNNTDTSSTTSARDTSSSLGTLNQDKQPIRALW